MAEIDIEKQPSTKETNHKPEPKNRIHEFSRILLKFGSANKANIKFQIRTTADGEKVQPAPEESPSKGPDSVVQPDESKKGGSRLILILKILAAIIFLIGLVNLILWVVINPRKMKVYVADASLTEFSLTNDNTLHYNLRLNFTVRNPNKRMGFRYVAIEGGAYDGGEKFDSGNLVSFYQPPKTTTGLDTWFSGAKKLSLSWDEVEGFEEQKSSGFYPIDVKIRVYSSIKLGKIHMGDFKVKIKCGLKVPLLSSSSGDGKSLALSTNDVAGFKTTQCHVDFNPLIVIYSD